MLRHRSDYCSTGLPGHSCGLEIDSLFSAQPCERIAYAWDPRAVGAIAGDSINANAGSD